MQERDIRRSALCCLAGMAANGLRNWLICVLSVL
jgi:hypothetical protein